MQLLYLIKMSTTRVTYPSTCWAPVQNALFGHAPYTLNGCHLQQLFLISLIIKDAFSFWEVTEHIQYSALIGL